MMNFQQVTSQQTDSCFMQTPTCTLPVAKLTLPGIRTDVPVCLGCLDKTPKTVPWAFIPGRRPA